MSLYLGFDSSTQSLTATAIEVDGDRRSVIATRTFQFDEALPSYGTHHGVLPSRDGAVVHAPPIMWAEAMELMFDALTTEHDLDWQQLRAISGSAQQHGSVYLTADATSRLGNLRTDRSIKEQIADTLSRSTAPVWMDSSTTEDCRAIEAAVGGAAALATVTGSRAFERFTGPQIRKFAREDPAGYQRTDRIHLVSSWMASLLAGGHAPIDRGDGSGMNLLDLAAGQWSRDALNATAAGLDSKLAPPVPSSSIVGMLSAYWMVRFNLPAARIVAWSGDNLCSLVGTGLVHEGQLAISLGTSDTIFGVMSKPSVSPDGTGHVFASPTGEFMGMTVFKNGSLARERIRNACGLDWDGFSDALAAHAAREWRRDDAAVVRARNHATSPDTWGADNGAFGATRPAPRSRRHRGSDDVDGLAQPMDAGHAIRDPRNGRRREQPRDHAGRCRCVRRTRSALAAGEFSSPRCRTACLARRCTG